MPINELVGAVVELGTSGIICDDVYGGVAKGQP
jgi:hypothetical protein